MLRSVLSVVTGTVVWTVLWLAFHAVMGKIYPHEYDGKTRIENISLLLITLVYSVVLSIIAGYITAYLAKHKEMQHAFALGLLQLALGIFFQSQSWTLFPLWYHLGFLALLIPANLFGGRLRLQQNGKILTAG